ncbi:hypothetical protein BESB_035170 [Besnoitia besnoiti]|uniref:Uncharacterized protein n=1 Tax=Besnoitia besnoiti TaxID=94643 RepID=A0A2A9MGM3_BESBE|nr:hypothetical protein BESB_035170 [Besnoitia besnoiti]PFH37059.1 hypothetical protein BESB_035170 [Besnoitia besnoiti]
MRPSREKPSVWDPGPSTRRLLRRLHPPRGTRPRLCAERRAQRRARVGGERGTDTRERCRFFQANRTTGEATAAQSPATAPGLLRLAGAQGASASRSFFRTHEGINRTPSASSRKAFFSAKSRDIEDDINWRSTASTQAARGGAGPSRASLSLADEGKRSFLGSDHGVAKMGALGSKGAETSVSKGKGDDVRRQSEGMRRAPSAFADRTATGAGAEFGLSAPGGGRRKSSSSFQLGQKGGTRGGVDADGRDDGPSPTSPQGRLVRGSWTREALLQRPEVLSAMSPEERRAELEQSRQQLAELQESLMWTTATNKRDKKKASATNRRVERQLASLESFIGMLSSIEASSGSSAAQPPPS